MSAVALETITEYLTPLGPDSITCTEGPLDVNHPDQPVGAQFAASAYGLAVHATLAAAMETPRKLPDEPPDVLAVPIAFAVEKPGGNIRKWVMGSRRHAFCIPEANISTGVQEIADSSPDELAALLVEFGLEPNYNALDKLVGAASLLATAGTIKSAPEAAKTLNTGDPHFGCSSSKGLVAGDVLFDERPNGGFDQYAAYKQAGLELYRITTGLLPKYAWRISQYGPLTVTEDNLVTASLVSHCLLIPKLHVTGGQDGVLRIHHVQ
ncbi:MAG TPA: hypothetical protein VMB52_02500 [Verrucomicrobiae bacterium]|nr:hypothetical protein [Verrucomicrobiae bacterium]